MINHNIQLASAKGDYLIDTQGKRYFDLCMGYGSVSLGHNYKPIIEAQQNQLQTYTSPGFLESDISQKAKYVVEQLIEGYQVHGFYPSGANAVEIALKMAMASNKKTKIISFKNSMHGKTLFANTLGFNSCFKSEDHIIQLPFVGECTEEYILEQCKHYMGLGDVSAIIIEPIQMSGGGYQASPSFYLQLEQLAKQYGVIQIYDEILTGFYRTGELFFCKSHGLKPDLILGGKAMGSGFPVSVILESNTFSKPKHCRSGGTYFNHPLACASVIATLEAYQELQVNDRIKTIERCIKSHLPKEILSGSGALWNINIQSKYQMLDLVKSLKDHGIIVSFYDTYIRFFPNYQVDLLKLEEACNLVTPFLYDYSSRPHLLRTL